MKIKSLMFLFCISSIIMNGCSDRNVSPPSESVIVIGESDNRIEEISVYSPDAPVSKDIEGSESISPNKEVPMDSNRTIYKQDFYYEPLSDNIKTKITGHSYADNCTVPYEDLRYVCIQYYNFDGKTCTGEIICNKKIAQDLVEIFYQLYVESYPIERIHLIDDYNADDELSCLDNNTSSFNYRVIDGTDHLSNHALGLAIDINPLYNPYITTKDGKITIYPYTASAYVQRDADFIAKIDHDDLAYKLFTEHGFTWGGDWNSVKDYQHFEKAE